MKAIPVAISQAYLVGLEEEEDFVLVLTVSSDEGTQLWCTFHHMDNCNHVDQIRTSWSSPTI